MCKCKICGSNEVQEIWNGKIRSGKWGTLTPDDYVMHRCDGCGVIWHRVSNNQSVYYESEQYRKEANGDTSVDFFYKNYDKEVLKKLQWIGTDCIRGKIIADIGCAAGCLLDFLSGPAKEVLAIEPSEIFKDELKNKGYRTYSYTKDAIYDGAVADLVTSFDVIEHVDNPLEFMDDIYNLCVEGGMAVIGTPSQFPIACELIGDEFKRFHYRYQHPWIFSMESLCLLAEKSGFKVKDAVYKQRYNLSNLLNWMKNRRPMGNDRINIISDELEDAYIKSCEEMGVADYILVYLKKEER